jgi:hypothetical protein
MWYEFARERCGLGVLRTFRWIGGSSNSRRLGEINKQNREKTHYM